MSKKASKPLRSHASWAFVVWLCALIVFLLWTGWVFFAGDAEDASDNAATAPGMVEGAVMSVLRLPENAPVSEPELLFDAGQAYVLAGAALQGFYQRSAPDDVWTTSSPEPQIVAQVIRRGPPTPRRMTRGINVSWELVSPEGAGRPQSGQMDAVGSTHFQAALPEQAFRPDGQPEPYRVVKLRAEDRNSGRLLAESAVVLAMSPGFGCAHCHENGGTAILEVHDRHQSTKLQKQHADGEVIACRSCHAGLSSGLENDAEERPEADLSLSAAIHGWHAPFLAGKAEDACMTCHIGMVQTGDDSKYSPKPLFARDFHIDRGLNCTRCHGYMEDHALTLLKAEHETGKVVATKAMDTIRAREHDIGAIVPRQPWVQQPDCTSCHDFSKKPDLLNASAFNKWTAGQDRASGQGGAPGLFSERRDFMSMVRCVTCHGAPHAVYPARNPLSPNLDNMPPLQYQEQAAPFGDYNNCAMCHGEPRENSAHHPLVKWSDTEIHIPDGVERMMPAARFPHSAHVQVVSCNTCHHTGHEDGRSLLCTSSGCHDGAVDTSDTDAGKETAYRYFYNAFHGSFPSCVACHTESLAEGKPAGPVDCQACHQAPSSRWSESAPATPESGNGATDEAAAAGKD